MCFEMGNLEGKGSVLDLRIDGSIILKVILQK